MFAKVRCAAALSTALAMAGCTTTSQETTVNTVQAPQTTTMNFATNGERTMYQLGQCLVQKGQNACGSQIRQACDVIASEAFRNARSSQSVRAAYQGADRSTRQDWERKTANLAMRQAGLGSPC